MPTANCLCPCSTGHNHTTAKHSSKKLITPSRPSCIILCNKSHTNYIHLLDTDAADRHRSLRNADSQHTIVGVACAAARDHRTQLRRPCHQLKLADKRSQELLYICVFRHKCANDNDNKKIFNTNERNNISNSQTDLNANAVVARRNAWLQPNIEFEMKLPVINIR